jgi:hypothetical protein
MNYKPKMTEYQEALLWLGKAAKCSEDEQAVGMQLQIVAEEMNEAASLRAKLASAELDSARLEAVRLAALEQVAFEVSAIPESHLENGRIQHNGILLIHRILATGEPDGVLKSDAARSATQRGKAAKSHWIVFLKP